MGSLTLTELFKGRYSFVAPRKYGGFFRKESEHRDFISIGTAAGNVLMASVRDCSSARTSDSSSSLEHMRTGLHAMLPLKKLHTALSLTDWA